MVRRGWLERGPGPDVARGTDEFVAVGWDEVLDRLAAELTRVYGGPGPEAVFGGSYGWSSAGRFHHAQSQVHRFLNCLGGYVRSVNTYSVGTSEVVLPRIFGRRADLLRSLTAWPLIAAHTELLVCFGGIPAKNLAVAPGGVTRAPLRRPPHRDGAPRRRGGAGGPGPGRPARRAPRPVAAAAARHRRRADAGAVPGSGRRRPARRRASSPRYCAGGDEALAYLDGSADGVEKSPRWAAAICGVPADTIVALAREMAARHTMVTVSWSLQRAEHGEQPVWAGVLLAALLGRMGLPGAGFGHGYGSMADSGVPINGVGPPTLPQLVNPVRAAIPVARIADMLLSPGAAYTYNGERRRYPYIELVYWSGGNPFHHHQDLARLRRAFRAVSTVVVHEPYWTATARHADIVLPATVTLERDDIGAARTDPYLTADAPARAAVRAGPRRLRDVLRAGRAARGGRGVHRGARRRGWLRHLYEQWRPPLRPRRAPDFDSFWRTGRVALDPTAAAGVFLADFRADPAAHPLATPSGRIELHSATVAGFGLADCPGHPVWLEPGEWHGAARAADYPLVLLANNPSARLHSQLDFGPHSAADKVAGREPLRMHPGDAAARGLVDGDLVRVFNDRGACLAGLRLVDRPAAGRGPDVDGRLVLPGRRTPAARPCCARRATSTCSPPTSARRASPRAARAARALVEVQRWEGDAPPVASAGPPPVRGG